MTGAKREIIDTRRGELGRLLREAAKHGLD
jgi:hypothetical protein